MLWSKRNRRQLPVMRNWETEVEALADGNQISCRVTNSILKYLEAMGFDPAQVAEGLPFTLAHLRDPFNWVSCAVRDELTARAKTLSGDEDFMYHMALESARLGSVGGVEQMVRLLASPRMVYRLLPHYAKFFDRTCDFKVRLNGPNRATVTLVWSTDYPITKDRCRYTQGILTAIPTLWGLPPAGLVETACGCAEGGSGTAPGQAASPGCVYEVSWVPLPSLFIRATQAVKERLRGHTDPTAELERNFHLLDLKNSQLLRRSRQLAGVRDLALAISQADSLESVLNDLPARAIAITGVRWVLVMELENQLGVLHTVAARASPNVTRDGQQTINEGHGLNRASLEEFGLPPPEDILMVPGPVELDAARVSALDQAGFILPETPERGRKVVLVPVVIQTNLWGFVIFGVNGDMPPDILEMCAGHLATGLQTAQMVQAVEERNLELTALNAVAHSLNASLELDEVLAQAAAATSRAFKAGVAVHLLDEDDGRWLIMQASHALPKDAVEPLKQVPLEGSNYGLLFTSGQGDAEPYAGGAVFVEAWCPQLVPVKYEQIMALLRSEGRAWGVLSVFRVLGAGFSDRERSLLRAIGNQLSVAIDNARLHQNLKARVQEAEAARGSLQQALDRQMEFNRILAHEVKTPLTSILACSELIRPELKGEAACSLGGLIEHSARNLNQRVDDLVDLSRGDLGNLRIHAIATDLLEIIKDTYRQMAPLAREYQLLFSMDIPVEMDYVIAQEGRVRQVLVNLLENSFRNTPPGGSVTVHARREGNNACVAVTDSGKGIPELEMKWLFDPYHRRMSDQERFGGLGLGLPLSKHIVELHGGQLQVASTPGAGTVVSFTLPMADARPAGEPVLADATIPPG